MRSVNTKYCLKCAPRVPKFGMKLAKHGIERTKEEKIELLRKDADKIKLNGQEFKDFINAL